MRSEGEVVLIYHQDQPTVYARIEGIAPDVKKGWFQITLLLLTVPAQTVTWILRESYIEGASFTMQDVPVRLETVKGIPARKETNIPDRSEKKETPGKIIPFKKF